jgi:hypothetical protein
MMSVIEFRLASAADQQQQMQLLLLNDDMIRQMGLEPPAEKEKGVESEEKSKGTKGSKDKGPKKKDE